MPMMLNKQEKWISKSHRSVKDKVNGCWYCGKLGHYKAYCYGYALRINRARTEIQSYPNNKRTKYAWVRKHDLYCNVAFTAENASGTSENEEWYFDSGCSRHMTGTQEHLVDFERISAGRVTFGDGARGKIKGKGITGGEIQPDLENVYLVDGLKANLISISQLCDTGMSVTFTKTECTAVDDHGRVRFEGQRSDNNCYRWKPRSLCLSTVTETQTEIWHRKLGHLNIRTMIRLSNQEVVRGLPKLKQEQNLVCGPCTKGKQVKVQHQAVPDVKSTRALELVHMDLMGPIQVESLSGKRYILVLVDDFTRYTWVRFLREKSETLESFRILALQLENEKWGIKSIRSDHGGEF
ncbi:Retrovirus-related Pol polyprotein from transposon RE1 [Cardamine amara subsp. amara]|uniref:Retrovirus-related Pol polyprotein from transposon RE1 n=1 Tax=Cardamine amara subsp. amara TaxID=228776 RepID=A0ABD0ZX39_CARAN